MSLVNVWYQALSYLDDANSSRVSSVSNPCLEFSVVVTWSTSVVVSCPIAVEPTIAIGVPDLLTSESDNSTRYIVILHVPAVPLAPLSLTLPPLMSAVNVASGVVSALDIIRLYSVMNASVPLCTTNTSDDDTSLEVVLLTEI